MCRVVDPKPPKNIFDLPPLRDVIEQHGLLAQKDLGQNFLLNMDVTRRIAGEAGNFEDVTAVEIGPGPGGLTRALLERGAKVVAIERDHRCVEILAAIQETVPSRLQIIEGDALEISPQSIVPQGNIKIVANLPYNIGTILLIQWLSNLDRIISLTLMFQKEVALRLFARPRTKDYGRLSVITQWLCEGRRLFDLAPGAFTPAPKIVSSVVHLQPKSLSGTEKALLPAVMTITRHAFGQRRKMIRSSLKPLFGEEKLTHLGLNPCARAEELTVADYLLLAQSISMPVAN
jgi:16S rRNA (adenine1518-N6/adenine1519-N6)-dimethyltransferase